MLTLILGFICLVLTPAIVLAIVMNWFLKRSDKSLANKDDFKFTL
jgi:hypothetical protein